MLNFYEFLGLITEQRRQYQEMGKPIFNLDDDEERDDAFIPSQVPTDRNTNAMAKKREMDDLVQGAFGSSKATAQPVRPTRPAKVNTTPDPNAELSGTGGRGMQQISKRIRSTANREGHMADKVGELNHWLQVSPNQREFVKWFLTDKMGLGGVPDNFIISSQKTGREGEVVLPMDTINELMRKLRDVSKTDQGPRAPHEDMGFRLRRGGRVQGDVYTDSEGKPLRFGRTKNYQDELMNDVSPEGDMARKIDNIIATHPEEFQEPMTYGQLAQKILGMIPKGGLEGDKAHLQSVARGINKLHKVAGDKLLKKNPDNTYTVNVALVGGGGGDKGVDVESDYVNRDDQAKIYPERLMSLGKRLEDTIEEIEALGKDPLSNPKIVRLAKVVNQLGDAVARGLHGIPSSAYNDNAKQAHELAKWIIEKSGGGEHTKTGL